MTLALARLPKDLVARIENKTSKKILTFGRDGLPVFNGATLEEHVSAWTQIDESLQCRFWAMGAIAASLVSKHNEQTIATFANHPLVKRSPRRIRQYAQTYRAFQNGNRFPSLSFRHHSVAATTNNPVRFAQLAADKGWSVQELEKWIKLNEPNRQTPRLVGLPSPGAPTLSGSVTVIGDLLDPDVEEAEQEDSELSAEEVEQLRAEIEKSLRVLSALRDGCQSPYLVSRYIGGWIEELDWELAEITKAPGKFSERVMSLINAGCYVKEQIAARARGSVIDTQQALDLLKKQRKIERRKQRKTQMARGLPTYLWMPVDMPAGSDLDLGGRPSFESEDEGSEEHY